MEGRNWDQGDTNNQQLFALDSTKGIVTTSASTAYMHMEVCAICIVRTTPSAGDQETGDFRAQTSLSTKNWAVKTTILMPRGPVPIPDCSPIGPDCLHWIALGFNLSVQRQLILAERTRSEGKVGRAELWFALIIRYERRLMYLCNVWVGKGGRRGGKWELGFNTPQCRW